jgi:hypothetical protein
LPGAPSRSPMGKDAHPPLRIAVTGHRYLAEIGKLREAVEAALDRIAALYPGRRWVVISALAEGADRLVTELALRRDRTTLTVPLPLPPSEYASDFGSARSRRKFERLLARAEKVVQLPPAPTREAAYVKVGEYVAEQAEVLIAVWDGREAQGEGGTATVVGRALRRGIPVFHIKAGNRKPGTTQPVSLGDEQGRLVIRNVHPHGPRA